MGGTRALVVPITVRVHDKSKEVFGQNYRRTISAKQTIINRYEAKVDRSTRYCHFFLPQ